MTESWLGPLMFAVAFLLLPLMFLSLYEPDRGGAARTGNPEPPPTLRQWSTIGAI